MDHNEVYEDTWRDNENKCLDYIKNDVSSSAFSYALYSKAMEDFIGFGMKDSLSLPALGRKYFNSLRTEADENIYTNSDKYMRWFVRQSIKVGRACAFI